MVFLVTTSLLDSRTKKVRSRQVSRGNLTWRLSTIICWRRSIFWSIGFGLLRVRSTAAFKTRAWPSGLVHGQRFPLTAWESVSWPRRKMVRSSSRAFLVGVAGNEYSAEEWRGSYMSNYLGLR
jgi:hypothetical protein